MEHILCRLTDAVLERIRGSPEDRKKGGPYSLYRYSNTRGAGNEVDDPTKNPPDYYFLIHGFTPELIATIT